MTLPDTEPQEVREIFQSYGLAPDECATVVESLRKRPKDWVTFMMRFELGLESTAETTSTRMDQLVLCPRT